MPRPVLDEIELQQVQILEVEEQQVLAQHAVPALEGDFLQRLDRRATQVALRGILSGPQARQGLEQLRERFRGATPISFVADIASATVVEQVLIEELSVRELAGTPQCFEYALTLREYIEPPQPESEPPEEPPPAEPDADSGVLEVEVVVEGQPDFDFSGVQVTMRGDQASGESLTRTLNEREGAVWTDSSVPPGQYTVEAQTNAAPEMSGTAEATIRAGQTTRVTITLTPAANVAKTFLI